MELFSRLLQLTGRKTKQEGNGKIRQKGEVCQCQRCRVYKDSFLFSGIKKMHKRQTLRAETISAACKMSHFIILKLILITCITVTLSFNGISSDYNSFFSSFNTQIALKIVSKCYMTLLTSHYSNRKVIRSSSPNERLTLLRNFALTLLTSTNPA